MVGDDQRDLVLETYLDAYRPYFDHDWAREIADRVAGTVLDAVVIDLCLSWKSTAGAQSFPWLMARGVERTLAGYARGSSDFTKRVITAFARRLEDALGDKLPPEDRHEIAMHAEAVAANIDASFPVEKPPLLAQDYWDDLCTHPAAVMATWGLCRSCFVATYYAYEDFTVRVLRHANGTPNRPRFRLKVLADDFRKCFGEELTAICLEDNRILAAREVRHALVHNGGRITDRLKRMEHGFEVTNGGLVIRPSETRALFDLLKDPSLKLATSAVRSLNADGRGMP